ncbi:unnamed protein product, partial [Discosporangium mesarthrocarpum]
MVDYSKWNDLHVSDSDSDPEPVQDAPERERLGVATNHMLHDAEARRLQGNSCFEAGKFHEAIDCYEQQLSILKRVEGPGASKAEEAAVAARLNQITALIKADMFPEAEGCCNFLLSKGGVGRTGYQGTKGETRTRVLHFRGFCRLRIGRPDDARTDLKKALEASGDDYPRAEEIRALLVEAEAGAELRGCPSPEHKGRELLKGGDPRGAAKYFQEAASRARRMGAGVRGGRGTPTVPSNSRRHPLSSDGNGWRDALAGAVRMEAMCMAAAGEGEAAVNLARGALKELEGAGPGAW